MAWRYIAQRIAGPSRGEFLDWNLPLSGVELSDGIGSAWLKAKIEPEITFPMALDGRPVLDKWSTAIWAEENGLIRGGGILVDNQYAGPVREINCMGYSGYPVGIPYADVLSRYDIDPLDIVRLIWGHVQGYASGDLSMVVDSSVSPIRIGTQTTAGGASGPYTLNWWEATDCGEAINTLAGSTPFEFREIHAWSVTEPDKIDHRLQLGYPRIGTRRSDLRFVVGENVFTIPPVSDDGTEFANEIIGLGKGTGRTIVTANAATSDNRLRRPALLIDNTVDSIPVMQERTKVELIKKSGDISIASIIVTDHPNARINSWQPGDEIFVQAGIGWDSVAIWCRIMSSQINPDQGNQATLTLEAV